MSRWSLLVASLMFIASIWFVLASARPGGTMAAAGAAGVPAAEPIATVHQLMTGIVGPASTTVYESVSIVIDRQGEKENYPQDEAEWDAVAGAAAALAESGSLLMVADRPGARDTDSWRKLSQDMIDASLISMKAAQARDKEALLASGEALNASCDSCHRSYDIDE